MGIFDQIKNAFSSSEDRPAKKTGSLPPAPEPQPEPAPIPAAESGPRTYTVQSGDTLWKIAEENLGDGNRFSEIYEANRDVLDNPDHILPGQELKLP